MPISKRNVCLLILALLVAMRTPSAKASAYDAHPKLVVVLVIDQFRGDYLDRYRADFKGRGFRLFLDHGAYFEDCYYDYANTETAPGHATLGTGAYTDGHGIAANSWWDLDRNKERPVTSVEDERYHLIGLPQTNAAGAAAASNVGASPLNLRASTVGDSLRLATQGQAKVFGVSLKDRAAILPVGYSANGAFWIDPASGAFITSSFYMTALPGWAADFNAGDRASQARQEAGVSSTANFYNAVGRSPAANSYELDFARALITGEQLGHGAVTDMLVISLSANDIAGHQYGPDSPEEQAMVDDLDQQFDSFFTWLDKNIPGGLANVWIALSADHGIAPVVSRADAMGLPAAGIDLQKLTASLNSAMNDKFSPGENVPYLLPQQALPYLALDRPSFEAAGINEQEAEQAVEQAVPAAIASLAPPAGATIPVPPPPAPQEQSPDPAASLGAQTSAAAPGRKTARSRETKPAEKSQPAAQGTQKQKGNRSGGQSPAAGATPSVSGQNPETAEAPVQPPPVRLQPAPIVVHTYTRVELAAGQLPPSEWGELLAHSYSPDGGWYVMVIPAAFDMPVLTSGTTHFTPWSYDRHVPLAFFGAPFTPGIYHGRVEPVDLAATLASLLGVNQPSASIGKVLSQAIHNVPAPPPARPVRPVRPHAGAGKPEKAPQ